jgi:hypothetical protein
MGADVFGAASLAAAMRHARRRRASLDEPSAACALVKGA